MKMKPKNICTLCFYVLVNLVGISQIHASVTSDVKPDVAVYLKAYPEFLSAIQGNKLIWKDGTIMPLKLNQDNNPKNFQEALDHPDLFLQLSIPYPKGILKGTPAIDSDPGRIRYVPFFQKMYGKSKDEIKKNLVEIDWMPKTFTDKEATKILVTRINGVSEKMKKISEELDELVLKKPEFKKYLKNPGGTFSYRLIAGTNRPSAHSFGMTIDINVDHSHYWLWDYKKNKDLPIDDVSIQEKDLTSVNIPPYQNKIPYEIVKIFEKYHFIWGGKWFHYDTMHFEYRPEFF